MIDFDLWVQYLSQNLLWYSVKRHIYQYPCICHKSLLIKGSAYFYFGKFIWCQFYIMKGYPSVYEFVLKNEIKLFLKSLLELILWNTVSYVLCFLLVFYIAQVSAFLLYPPFCYVSYMCLLIISLFFLILSWRLWLSVSLCSRLLWSIPDNVICWVPDVNLRLSRWFTLVCSWFYFFLFISRDQYICRQEVTINPS